MWLLHAMEDVQRIAREDDAKLARTSSNAGTARYVPDMAGMPSSPPPLFWCLHGGPAPEITHGRAWAQMGTCVSKRSRPRCDQRVETALHLGLGHGKPVDSTNDPEA